MACKTNINPEVLYNLIKHKLPMKPDPGQTMEQTMFKLELMSKHLTISDEKYKYADLDIKNRLSDKIGKKIPSTPDSEILKKTRKDTKALIYSILEKELGGEDRIKEIQKNTKFSDEQVAVLRKGVKKFLSEVVEKYPDSRVRIAQPVVDPKKDLATTIDLLVIHPDNSANMYAFHTFSGETMYNPAIEAYHKQQVERRDILLNTIGITSIRKSQIIPIQVKNSLKARSYDPSTGMSVRRPKGQRLTPEIHSVSMLGASEEEQQEYLDYIPVAFEKTGEKGVDAWIQKQYNVIETLKEQVKKEPVYEKRVILWDKISSLEKGIRAFLRKMDFSLVDDYVTKKLGPVIEAKLADVEFLASDDLFAQLAQWELELSTYTNIAEDFRNFANENLSPTERAAFNKAVYSIKGYAESLLSQIKVIKKQEIQNRVGESLDEVQNAPNWFERTFSRLSGFSNPLFKRFSQLIRANHEKNELELEKDIKEILKANEELWNWAKDNGINRDKLIDIFVNKNTGDLYGKISPEGLEILKGLQAKKNPGLMKKVYEIKQSWLDNWESLKAKKRRQFEDMYYSENEAETAIAVDIAMREWLKDWDLLNSPQAWTNPKLLSKLKLKQSFIDEYKSEQYKYIESIPALNQYYKTYTEKMYKYLTYTGLNQGEDRKFSNMLPNIRKEVNEHLVEMDFKGAVSETFNFNIREDDYGIGLQDENGVLKSTIPILFTNPLSLDQKSMDFTRSLILFGKMAINYKSMAAIEQEVLAMKDLLGTMEYYQKSPSNNPVINFMRELQKSKDISKVQQQVFDDFVNYYLYGVHTKEKGVTIGGINTTKLAQGLLTLTRRNLLGLNVIAGVAGGAASKMGEYISSYKGGAITRESYKKADKALLSSDRKRNIALNEAIGLYNEDIVQRQKSSSYYRDFRKIVNDKLLFSPFRIPDELVDRHITIAVSFNYGIDGNGNIKQIKNLPKGTPTINDLFKYDDETGKYHLEGYNQEESDAILRKVRRVAQEVQYGIKGSIQEDDRRSYENSIYGQVLMAFKNFMPGLITERAKRFSYNEVTDTADIGRYVAYYNNYLKKIKDVGEDGKLINDTWGTVLRNIIASSRILVFNFIETKEVDGVSSRLVDVNRAKIAYKEFLLNYPSMKDKVTFQQFVDAQEGQLKAMAIELRVILGLIALSMILSIEGDDDEPLYEELGIKKPYRMLKKSLSELMYFYNPLEIVKLQQNPVVILKPITQAMKAISNTLDEGRDWIFEENNPRDNSDVFFYTRGLIPGVNQITRYYELYSPDERILD